MDRHPAPPPNPYPLGPYLRPWQFLQNKTASCSLQFVESRALLHMPGGDQQGGGGFISIAFRIVPYLTQHLLHLKQVLWNLYPPATRSSAAYTDLLHLGHLGVSAATKGILGSAIGTMVGRWVRKMGIIIEESSCITNQVTITHLHRTVDDILERGRVHLMGAENRINEAVVGVTIITIVRVPTSSTSS